MKVIDKNGRLFGQVSIIDVVVVLLVIVLAVALRHKAQLPQTGTTVAETPITIQVWARNLRPEIVDSIHIGDGLYDPDRTTGGAIGRVTDIQVSEGTIQGELMNGEIVQLPCEGRVDLIITLEGKGLVENGRFLLNRVYELGVNSSRTFCTKYAEFIGTVTEIF